MFHTLVNLALVKGYRILGRHILNTSIACTLVILDHLLNQFKDLVRRFPTYLISHVVHLQH